MSIETREHIAITAMRELCGIGDAIKTFDQSGRQTELCSVAKGQSQSTGNFRCQDITEKEHCNVCGQSCWEIMKVPSGVEKIEESSTLATAAK